MEIHLLVNPLTYHIFLPFTMLLVTIFAGAALTLYTLQRRAYMHQSITLTTSQAGLWPVLWQRYQTWVLIALLFVAVAFSGPLPITLLCAFITWQGTREYADLTDLARWQCTALFVAGWLTQLATLLTGTHVLTVTPIIAFFICSLLGMLPGHAANEHAELHRRFARTQASLWGYLYLGWLPTFLLALSLHNSAGLILTVGLGVALSDIGAFCVGKLLAGPKLAPHLSPSKTWSGVLGTILGASLALLLTSFALPSLPLWHYGLLALVISLGSVWGDLLESLLKRQNGVKDAGNLLAGFGGLLDRIDSMLLVAPAVFYLSLWLIH